MEIILFILERIIDSRFKELIKESNLTQKNTYDIIQVKLNVALLLHFLILVH